MLNLLARRELNMVSASFLIIFISFIIYRMELFIGPGNTETFLLRLVISYLKLE